MRLFTFFLTLLHESQKLCILTFNLVWMVDTGDMVSLGSISSNTLSSLSTNNTNQGLFSLTSNIHYLEYNFEKMLLVQLE